VGIDPAKGRTSGTKQRHGRYRLRARRAAFLSPVGAWYNGLLAKAQERNA
jgi:hypothetical protein